MATARKFTERELERYKKVFRMYDLNGDGAISARELRKVSRQMGYRLTDRKITDIMRERDLDESGSLDFEEFLQALPGNMTLIPEEEQRMAEIRAMFMEYDKDGNGYVSAEEAHEILEKELAFTNQQSVELVQRYDKNGDGQLSYEEFVKFYSKVKAKADKIKQMFREFDRDGSGSISTVEVKSMLRRLGIPDKEIETLVALHDTNQDGELQYEEFVSFVLHT